MRLPVFVEGGGAPKAYLFSALDLFIISVATQALYLGGRRAHN
jgi:hypothetical protein